MSRSKSVKSVSSGHNKVSPTTLWDCVVAMLAEKNKKAELESRRRRHQQAAA